MGAANALHVVEGGDHSQVASRTSLKARTMTQEQSDRRILDADDGLIHKVVLIG